jgi:hypothetical protein
MEISIDIAELQKRKLMVSTTMYVGVCSGHFTKNSVDLSAMATQMGLDIKVDYLFNESLIPRARNYLVDEFLRNKQYTHFLFIDSDIGFDPNDVVALLAIADPNSDKDIVCMPYPKKCISWEKIKRAVDKGFADQNPNVLENFVGDFVFNPAAGTSEIPLDRPVEVLESGTGFMMIQRRVFEKFEQAYPEYKYTPDHVRTEHFDGSRQIMAYFHCEIDKPSFEREFAQPKLFTI